MIDLILALLALLALAADFRQTLKIAASPEQYYERNPILGRHPTAKQVRWYFGVATLALALLAVSLQGELRTGLLAIIFGVEALVVYRNREIGLQPRGLKGE